MPKNKIINQKEKSIFGRKKRNHLMLKKLISRWIGTEDLEYDETDICHDDKRNEVDPTSIKNISVVCGKFGKYRE